MSLVLVSSKRFVDHVTPAGHPERPERAQVLEAVAASFKEADNPVEALGFPPSGDLLFVGGRTRSKFYRLAELIKDPPSAAFRLITLTGVTSVDFSADGQLAVFGTTSSGVRLWGMP